MKKLLKDTLDLIRYVYRRYHSDGCNNSAAALTYMTLFAVVPLTTVMYAILSAVPAFQEVGLQIQQIIFDNFVPATGQGIEKYLEQFSQQARKLTGVGVVFLGITAVLMLKNIEKTFNAIWKTRENRSGIASFLLYWAILSLGPIFIGLAIGISTYLLSLKVIAEQVEMLSIGPQLLRFTPYLLISAAFTLIFTAVPNCRVPIKHAIIGGLISALIFEVAKQLFTGIVSNTSYQTIYGTFATVPLFLLWIYLSWIIVLAGAEFVYALGGFKSEANERFNDFTLCVAVLELLWRKHQQGNTVSEHDLMRTPWLFNHYSISPDRWLSIRNFLFQGGLIRTDETGKFILGRDLDHYTLWDLSCLLGHHTDTQQDAFNDSDQWFQSCLKIMNDSQQQQQQHLSISLTQLFTTSASNPATTAP
ncbi:YihY family inner membrane protein [Oceanicoccus sp. KOV_DT_Chl]|uniref:YihY family inner membrane protein n=1 Tax=Oceanicoccus sp. KOV_DT_Chl TaxID=1904639 RepID=UPI000C7DC63C|nr:YihY family inner membrane protein [Oceanicoccus sp. KOV_DT_Chl]